MLNGYDFEPREYIFCPFHNLNYHLPSCITVCCLPSLEARDHQYFYPHFRNFTNNRALAFQCSLSVIVQVNIADVSNSICNWLGNVQVVVIHYLGKWCGYLSLHYFGQILFHKDWKPEKGRSFSSSLTTENCSISVLIIAFSWFLYDSRTRSFLPLPLVEKILTLID